MSQSKGSCVEVATQLPFLLTFFSKRYSFPYGFVRYEREWCIFAVWKVVRTVWGFYNV